MEENNKVFDIIKFILPEVKKDFIDTLNKNSSIEDYLPSLDKFICFCKVPKQNYFRIIFKTEDSKTLYLKILKSLEKKIEAIYIHQQSEKICEVRDKLLEYFSTTIKKVSIEEYEIDQEDINLVGTSKWVEESYKINYIEQHGTLAWFVFNLLKMSNPVLYKQDNGMEIFENPFKTDDNIKEYFQKIIEEENESPDRMGVYLNQYNNIIKEVYIDCLNLIDCFYPYNTDNITLLEETIEKINQYADDYLYSLLSSIDNFYHTISKHYNGYENLEGYKDRSINLIKRLNNEYTEKKLVGKNEKIKVILPPEESDLKLKADRIKDDLKMKIDSILNKNEDDVGETGEYGIQTFREIFDKILNIPKYNDKPYLSKFFKSIIDKKFNYSRWNTWMKENGYNFSRGNPDEKNKEIYTKMIEDHPILIEYKKDEFQEIYKEQRKK
jgi:hypothetical protein